MHDTCLHNTYGELSGQCCCNCEHQRPITAHPWNKDPYVNGSVSKVIGYGCACPEFFPHITFSDREHSLCECWTENTYRKEMAAQELKRNKEYVWKILSQRGK